MDNILSKINSQNVSVLDIFEGIYQGIITTGDDIFILKGEINENIFVGYSKALNKEVEIESNIMKPILKGEDIRRYTQPQSKAFVIYPHTKNLKNKTVPISEEVMKYEYPLAYEYLSNFKDHLVNKKIKYKMNATNWYAMHRPREQEILDRDKIITPQLQNYPHFALDKNSCYPDAGGYSLLIKNEYYHELMFYYGILNSKLFWSFIMSTSTVFNNNYYYFKTAYIKDFRFPDFVEESTKMQVIDYVIDILNTKKIDSQKSTFEIESKIDRLVYDMYELTEDEIKRVEEM